MSIDDDYTEADRWDWDYNDFRQRCRHGQFIGSSWGPDIICGRCEMGEDPTIAEMLREIYAETKRLDDSAQVVTNFVSKIAPFLEGESRTAVLAKFQETLEEKIALHEELSSKSEWIKKTYGPFSDDWLTDRDVLDKYHRHQIAEFESRKDER